ncbi:hypothetical protein CEXT_775371 [Caerostris extrusa]|uniref:Uncharacterized protein n=1 Tax=Caerostris extrusa TaxID=172846 RepID=A0AAV4MK86_CAEEX|nr:hypothetical protein CEXT_775371 [Caerostris extrusa]
MTPIELPIIIINIITGPPWNCCASGQTLKFHLEPGISSISNNSTSYTTTISPRIKQPEPIQDVRVAATAEEAN